MTFTSFHYEAPLPALGTEVLTVILENLSIVMTFAFSQEALAKYYGEHYHGRFKFLERAFFDAPHQRAIRACIELAVMYRALDDIQNITARREEESFGDLYNGDEPPKPLRLRDLVNKIIHAQRIEWDFSKDIKEPLIVCFAAANQAGFGWTKAEIRVTGLAEACSGLAC